WSALRDRTADVVLTHFPIPIGAKLAEDVRAEVLFQDRICLAVAKRGSWARRRNIGLADLIDAAFIAPSSEVPGGAALLEAFRAAGLSAPHITVTTVSVHVRSILGMRGRFIAVLPMSILRFNPGLYSMKELPIDLPMPRFPAMLVTLKNRTLSPAAERFLASARDIATSAPWLSQRGAGRR